MDVIHWKRGSTMSLILNGESSDTSQSTTEEKKGEKEFDKESQEGSQNSQKEDASLLPPYIVIDRPSCTSLEWFLAFVIMLLFCACAVLAAEFGLLFVKQSENTSGQKSEELTQAKIMVEQSNICFLPDCLLDASIILRHGNFKLDPCGDFHQFSCGGYEANAVTTPELSRANILEEKMNAAQDKLRAILDEPVSYSDPITVRKAKYFYQSCLDQGVIEARDVMPLQPLIDRVGGWPVVIQSSWRQLPSWYEIAQKFRRANLPVNFFFEPRVTFHTDKDQLKLVLTLSAAIHGLYTMNDELQYKKYYEHLVDAAVMFGAEKEIAEREMEEVFYFETMVKKRYWKDFNLNQMHVLMNISTLQNTAPSVNWTKYLETFLPYKLQDSDLIIVDSPQFLPKFIDLLSYTDTRVLANYAVARVVWSLAPLLTQKLKYKIGLSSTLKRPNECSDMTINYFSIPLASYYVRNYFPEKTKSMVEEIIQYLTESFLSTYEDTSWDNSTVEFAQNQIMDINMFVAYPEEILNDTSVEEIYSSITMHPDQYFENSRKIVLYLKDEGLKLLKQPPEALTKWEQNGGAALAANIMYFHRTHTTFIPAVILEDVFQVPAKPHYVNFASLGSIIAKEISKGLRLSRGGKRKEDSKDNGNKDFASPANGTMWCLAKQFHNFSNQFSVPYNGMDGFETPWEEIEDYLDHYRGLQVAYRAYVIWRYTQGWMEHSMPGMNFTADQLFWISYASMYCAKPSKASQFHYPFDRSYLRNKLRVNLAVANNPQFAKDFNCIEEKHLLHPATKCTAW